MLRQIKTLSSRSFIPLWCNLRSLSTSALCMQNVENTKAERPEEKNQQEREDLAAAYRGLTYYGLSEGVCNHLTARAPARNGDGEVMLIVEYGIHWSEVTASGLLGVNLDSGRVVEGDGVPVETSFEIHSAVYKSGLNTNPSIRAVFHTHPPNATALACLEDPTLEMISQNSARFFEDVAYDPGYEGLASTVDEGTRIANQLDGKSILFMGNHGVLVTGESTADAFNNTYYLEKAAQLQILAMSTGKKMSRMPDEIANFVKQQIKDGSHIYVPPHLDSIKRLISYAYPGDYAS